MEEPALWKVEVVEPKRLVRQLGRSTDREIVEAVAQMVVDLQSFGPVLFAAGKVKHIRDGLFQYRQRFSERLLLRAYFFSTAGNRLLILSAYNKQKDPSKKRQQNEIFRALKQKKMLEMYVLKQIE